MYRTSFLKKIKIIQIVLSVLAMANAVVFLWVFALYVPFNGSNVTILTYSVVAFIFVVFAIKGYQFLLFIHDSILFEDEEYERLTTSESAAGPSPNIDPESLM